MKQGEPDQSEKPTARPSPEKAPIQPELREPHGKECAHQREEPDHDHLPNHLLFGYAFIALVGQDDQGSEPDEDARDLRERDKKVEARIQVISPAFRGSSSSSVSGAA